MVFLKYKPTEVTCTFSTFIELGIIQPQYPISLPMPYQLFATCWY